MKFFAVVLALLMLVGCGREQFNNKQNNYRETSSVSSTEISEEKSEVQSQDSSLSVSSIEESETEVTSEILDQSDDWRLILVNPTNYIPDDFTVNLKQIHGYMVDERIAEPYQNMYDAALKDGVNLLLCYGYRTKEQSQQLLDKQINKQMANGLSREQAEIEAIKWVAPPGTSEHHTGLAVDVVTPLHQVLNHEFENTDAARWMKENSYKFGFIIRFPKGKEDITKITYEPWHLRYVGEEHAKNMFQNDLCLEEYLERIED